MPTMRGWHASTTFAPAAWRVLEMYQAKLWLSPTPVTSATLPERSIGIMETSENDAARGQPVRVPFY